MSINFTANLMSRTTIPQRISWRDYIDRGVSIVELDVNNPSDIEAMEQTKDKWLKKGAWFIHHICDDIVEPHNYYDIEKQHFYALTTQKADFNRLKSNDILGVMMFSETKNKANEITWLEVSPETNRALNRTREFKQVGTRLIDFVKSKFKEKDIYVHTAHNAKKFYKKNGFVSTSNRIPEKYDMFFMREG